MIFLEYLRISGTENTAGEQAPGHGGPRRAHHPGRAPCLVGPWWLPSTYSSYHTLLLPPKKSLASSNPSSCSSCCHFRSPRSKLLLKLLWGIVLWYVTPPMVQLVFVLVLYLLQIFVAYVTLFLSLHVKFIWFQVVLMHDIGSRHL